MDTRAIERMIERLDAGAEPDAELRDLLAAVADSRGHRADADDLDRAVAFVHGYINQVPYMIKVAWTSALRSGTAAPRSRTAAVHSSRLGS